MAVLITGGAGYIGSATVADLLEKGEDPVIIDNLVYGHRKAFDDKIPFYEGEIGDKNLIRKILQEHEISACMHFSAFAYVGESVEKPHKYWQNNVEQTLALLEVLLKNNIKNTKVQFEHIAILLLAVAKSFQANGDGLKKQNK